LVRPLKRVDFPTLGRPTRAITGRMIKTLKVDGVLLIYWILRATNLPLLP
jgi:hypothetical protein